MIFSNIAKMKLQQMEQEIRNSSAIIRWLISLFCFHHTDFCLIPRNTNLFTVCSGISTYRGWIWKNFMHTFTGSHDLIFRMPLKNMNRPPNPFHHCWWWWWWWWYQLFIYLYCKCVFFLPFYSRLESRCDYLSVCFGFPR